MRSTRLRPSPSITRHAVLGDITSSSVWWALPLVSPPALLLQPLEVLRRHRQLQSPAPCRLLGCRSFSICGPACPVLSTEHILPLCWETPAASGNRQR